MENKNKENKEVGALWDKTSKAGNQFKTGYVQLENGERVEIVVFSNQYKKAGDNTPNFRIYLSEQKAGAQETKGTSQRSTPKAVEVPSQEDTDEIPF
jgi:uncharacterized protein (DUF736 family)